MKTLPRVLLIAEGANPTEVSVPLIGWRVYEAMRVHADVHLVTQVRNEQALREAGVDESRFTAIDSEWIARPLHRLGNVIRGGAGKGWTTLAALDSISYYEFERRVWRRFRDELAAGAYDLVHRVTPLSPTRPSLLARRLRRVGVPFVLGPLNGGLPWHRGFTDRRHAEREWLSYVRGAHKFLPGYRSTRRDASAIIIASTATWAQVPARYRHKCVYIPENAVEQRPRLRRGAAPRCGPMRVAFLGRLVPYKGADMLLDAVDQLIRSGRVTLDIVGDGPQMPQLRRRVEEGGLTEGVTFHGWVDRTRVWELLTTCEVFAFPSIREFGGAVVLEAMAMGLVPVVVSYGGPAEFVTPRSGFTVPMGTRDAIVDGFRDLLSRLTRDRDSLPAIGDRARRHVLTHFTWEAKARQFAEVHDWVLGRRETRPDFGMPFPDADDEATIETSAGVGDRHVIGGSP